MGKYSLSREKNYIPVRTIPRKFWREIFLAIGDGDRYISSTIQSVQIFSSPAPVYLLLMDDGCNVRFWVILFSKIAYRIFTSISTPISFQFTIYFNGVLFLFLF